MISFTKMHGLGNDFLVVRAQDKQPPDPQIIRRLADRRTGIGFDQLLWLEPARNPQADIFYRNFNADGSPAEQCGNGARCIARYLSNSDDQSLLLEHQGGLAQAHVTPDGQVSIELGVPEFRPDYVPFKAPVQQPAYQVTADDTEVELRVVSIGNPHAVLQVDDVSRAPVATLGPLLENHELFPNRANIGFMQRVSPDLIRLRVYERGVGETQGCGTGACAAVVTGIKSEQLASQVVVEMPGGKLIVRWNGAGTPVWLTGEAVTVFEGTVDI